MVAEKLSATRTRFASPSPANMPNAGVRGMRYQKPASPATIATPEPPTFRIPRMSALPRFNAFYGSARVGDLALSFNRGPALGIGTAVNSGHLMGYRSAR